MADDQGTRTSNTRPGPAPTSPGTQYRKQEATGELAPGSRLHVYVVKDVLGAGGFGITYLAEHETLKRPVAIKEHFPRTFAVREGRTVRGTPSGVQIYEWGLQRFLREARLLAKLEHPAIVKVVDVFEAHGTAYMVLDFERGKNMRDWLAGLGRAPTQAELDAIVKPLLEALGLIHSTSMFHRDIAPDNIMIRQNGTPVLIDFGAAREDIGRQQDAQKSGTTPIVKSGYSPPEQYSRDAKQQGPWTDIYALGATLYEAVTGLPPVEATDRMIQDTVRPARDLARASYRPGFLAAIDHALRVLPRDRPRSVQEWRAEIVGSAASSGGRAPVGPGQTAPVVGHTAPAAFGPQGQGFTQPGQQYEAPSGLLTEERQQPARKDIWLKGVAVAALLLIGIAGGYLISRPSAETLAAREWVTLENSRDVAALTSFRDRYSRTSFARKADDRIASLQTPGPRIGSPPPTTTPPRTPPTPPSRSGSPRDAENAFNEGERFFYGRGVTRDYAQARTHYQRAVDLGHANAMVSLGFMYQNGFGVTRDYGESMRLYRRASDLGSGWAMNNIGWLFQNGWGMQQSHEMAAQWYRRAVEKDIAPAYNNLGWLFVNGWGVTRDYNEARRLFELGQAKGNLAAINHLGLMYQNGWGVQQNFETALRQYRAAADQGHTAAMTNIGLLYLNGQGVTRDYAQALSWFDRAAAQDEPNAINNLGWMIQNGWGRQRDLNLAARHYHRAAELGNDRAMTNLGWLYVNGWGVTRDYNQARSWFERAANLGELSALNNLGLLYQNGWGVTRDFAQAGRYYEQAATRGHVLAMVNYGFLLQQGEGVTRNDVAARSWYQKAADLNNAQAMHNLGFMFEKGQGGTQDYTEARRLYERASSLGLALSMTNVGWLHENGWGVPKNLEIARSWYQRAADGSDPQGAFNLAIFEDAGQGGPRDFDAAARHLLQAAKAGHQAARRNLAGDMSTWQVQTRRALQQELRTKGFFSGNGNGQWGSDSQQAAERYANSG